MAPIKPRLISEAEFSRAYSAAEFSLACGMILDTHLTFQWRAFGAEDPKAIQAYFLAFTKCLRDWLIRNHWPVAFIYSHENNPWNGLHSHLAVFVPGGGDIRATFRRWARGWPERQLGTKVPKGLRITGSKNEVPWVHWLLFNYLMKGFDRTAVVRSASHAADARTVYLGDLIAFPWRDPGQVPLRKRVGCSHSIGRQQRSLGLPLERPVPLSEVWRELKLESASPFPVLRPVPRLPTSAPPFRSKYEDGIRDVRELYGTEFFERVTRLPSTALASTADGMPDEEAMLQMLDVL